jgi:hypothetical protein
MIRILEFCTVRIDSSCDDNYCDLCIRYDLPLIDILNMIGEFEEEKREKGKCDIRVVEEIRATLREERNAALTLSHQRLGE